MLLDQNRVGEFTPTNPFFDANIVGSGSDNFGSAGIAIPETSTWLLLIAGFGMAGAALRRRRPAFAR